MHITQWYQIEFMQLNGVTGAVYVMHGDFTVDVSQSFTSLLF